jgi:hypothetical protein
MSLRTCTLCSSVFAARAHNQKYCHPCISSGAAKQAHYKFWEATHPEAARRHNNHSGRRNPASASESARKWYLRNRHKSRARHLKQAYGISLDEYNTMLSSQAGLCAICGRPPGRRNLAVDHDHQTGTVRALLCFSCNIALGLEESSGVPLCAVHAYRLKHTQPS